MAAANKSIEGKWGLTEFCSPVSYKLVFLNHYSAAVAGRHSNKSAIFDRYGNFSTHYKIENE